MVDEVCGAYPGNKSGWSGMMSFVFVDNIVSTKIELTVKSYGIETKINQSRNATNSFHFHEYLCVSK